MLQQSLCVKGYSASFAGACGAGSIGAGLVISLVVGAIVDNKAKMKAKLEEIVKVGHSGVSIYANVVFGCGHAILLSRTKVCRQDNNH